MNTFVRMSLLLVLVVMTDAFAPSTVHPQSSSNAIMTTVLFAGFRPSSKQQDKVAIDPKTGLYRPIKRQESNKKSLIDGEALASGWDAAKEVVYAGVDGLANLNKIPEKITSPLKKGKTDDSDSENIAINSGVVGGYADIERELGAVAIPKKVPRVAKPKTEEQWTTPVDRILASQNKNEIMEPLIPPTGLENVKRVFWSGIDTVRSPEPKPSSAQNNPSYSAAQTMSNTMESFQPAVRARMVASDEFLLALADMDSPNPVVRLAAGQRIKSLAKKEQAALREGPNPLTAVKQRFYQAVDTAQATKKTIQDLPRRVADTYQATVKTTNEAVRAAQQVPDNLEKQAKAIQQSVGKAVDNTQKTVKNIQELPGRVQTSIQETNAGIQRRVKETQETAQRMSQTVQDVTTQSKVLLGLEKPKPRPPNTPPPEPLTAKQVAWKILSVSGSLAAETTWFIGKNGAKLAWKAGSLATSLGGEVLSAKVKEYQEEHKNEPKAVARAKKIPKSATPTKAEPLAAVKGPPKADVDAETKSPESIAMTDLELKQKQQNQDMSALEMEIEEALRMADAAIQSAQAEIAQEKKTNKSESEANNDSEN